MTSRLDVEAVEAATLLDRHPDYKVLRRFRPQSVYNEQTDAHILRGLFIDTETTGTDVNNLDILEIALVPFLYQESGEIVCIEERRCMAFLQDPGKPLSDIIRHLTGIRDEDLAGQEFDTAAIADLVLSSDLVIAHNAGYDRKVVEAKIPLVPGFKTKPWACSQQDVPWRTTFGAPAERLEILAHFLGGIFYGAHRAMADCLVAVHLLATVRDENGRSAFSYLLENASQDSIRRCSAPSIPRTSGPAGLRSI